MAWNLKQKALVHIYKQAAHLPDQDYRHLLNEVSGATSAAFPGLTQYHFDHFMARLEGMLWRRVEEGEVEQPASGKIRDLHYWRERLPGTGQINSRQAHAIQQLFEQLLPYLSDDHRSSDYLLGMACKAARRRIVSLDQLAAWQASQLTDALKDRLRYAIRPSHPAIPVVHAPPTPPPPTHAPDFDTEDACEAAPCLVDEVPF